MLPHGGGTMVDLANQFSAVGSMVGYLYQCREALLLALEETTSFPNLFVSVERFDDIAFDEDGTPQTQLQVKHHGAAGNLTDGSVDLWKTIRIWSEQVAANPQLPIERRFVLITTATAEEGSIASKLRHPRRDQSDEAEALKRLEQIAASSSNKDTEKARNAFLALPIESRKNLLNSVHVRDNAPTITDARAEIEELLAFAAPLAHVPHLVNHLEGWWFAQIVNSLSSASGQSVSLLALRQKVDEIATAYKTDQLLLNEEVSEVSDEVLLASDTRVFVKQMRRVGLNEPIVEHAKRDYYRATAQRSAWARENVLLDGESQRYDEELTDRWRRERFAREATASLTSEDEKCRFGRDLFHWAHRAQLPFRNRHETWLCSGSYQVLADGLLVGWHPEHLAIFGVAHLEAV